MCAFRSSCNPPTAAADIMSDLHYVCGTLEGTIKSMPVRTSIHDVDLIHGRFTHLRWRDHLLHIQVARIAKAVAIHFCRQAEVQVARTDLHTSRDCFTNAASCTQA